MKILTICLYGNVRSVAMAYLLKTIFGINTIAIGLRPTDLETRKMLYEWADKIICMDTGIFNLVKHEQKDKVYLCDVGEDRWHNSKDQELLHRIYKQILKFV